MSGEEFLLFFFLFIFYYLVNSALREEAFQDDIDVDDDCHDHGDVHGGLLGLHFPLFRDIGLKDIRVVVMDELSTGEAELILKLAYGMGRCV